MRVIFMGTPEFSVAALHSVLAAGHQVVAVYTQPPRPAGRGHKLTPSPVQQAAEAASIPVYTPKTLKTEDAQEEFCRHQADIAVVVAYGLILPKAILEACPKGCLNIHASLLPRWRGAAPIQRAILAGDKEAGVTIMQMDEGLDTGAMLLKEAFAMPADITGGALHDKLSAQGASLVVKVLEGIEKGRISAIPQPEAGVTYAHKITKEDARIDWQRPAVEIERQVRAFNPWPAAWFTHQGEVFKVLAAEITEGKTGARPGEVLDEQLIIACGEGVLRLLQVQRQGKKAMDVEALLRGFAIPPKTVLE